MKVLKLTQESSTVMLGGFIFQKDGTPVSYKLNYIAIHSPLTGHKVARGYFVYDHRIGLLKSLRAPQHTAMLGRITARTKALNDWGDNYCSA